MYAVLAVLIITFTVGNKAGFMLFALRFEIFVLTVAEFGVEVVAGG